MDALIQPGDLHLGPIVLRWMSPAFLTACLRDDLALASSLIGLSIPREWLAEKVLMRLRMELAEVDPDYRPWSLRAIGVAATGQMAGHIAFHSLPGAAYLEPFAPGGVELGYTVFPAFQRRGYGRLAAAGMIRWAAGRGVDSFVVSISPENLASMALARRLGFVKVGQHLDEVDGLEEVHRLDGPALSNLLAWVGTKGNPEEGTA